ncbi:response regulator [Geomonas sp. Red32]|uniref:response regulator n=1 Tax=Geomonas sp. Red32 TaxID=2912856 RepID=UPI00202D0127|nr:response regulator [Geomonas sp. Red32]MCM0084024.1 response regulator [Geomonas sp. Red32]
MNKNILIIDDSELVLTMAKDALEEAGYQVATATNGIEANKHIFSKNRPGLIILDIMMPMLSGDTKAKLLKENETCKDIPILLLSSKSDLEMRQLAQETGADGYILKPFSPIQIASKVRRCLAGVN